MLSKTLFKIGVECPRKLFYAQQPQLYRNANDSNAFLKSLAIGGMQVGELAKRFFPGGSIACLFFISSHLISSHLISSLISSCSRSSQLSTLHTQHTQHTQHSSSTLSSRFSNSFFPSGVDASISPSVGGEKHESPAQRTSELLAGNDNITLFEATFQHGNLEARVGVNTSISLSIFLSYVYT